MKTYFYKDYTLKQLINGEAYDMAWDTLLGDDDFYDIKDEYAEAGIVLEEYAPENEDGVTTYTYTDEAGERRFVGVKEKAVMEQLMIKAIREFKKLYPDGEIRSVVVASWTGCYQKVLEASFEIEYVTEPGGQHYKEYIRVEK